MCRSKAYVASIVRKTASFGITAIMGIHTDIYQSYGFLFSSAGWASYAGYANCTICSGFCSGALGHSLSDLFADSAVFLNQIGRYAQFAGLCGVAVSNPSVREISACSGDIGQQLG